MKMVGWSIKFGERKERRAEREERRDEDAGME